MAEAVTAGDCRRMGDGQEPMPVVPEAVRLTEPLAPAVPVVKVPADSMILPEPAP